MFVQTAAYRSWDRSLDGMGIRSNPAFRGPAGFGDDADEDGG